MTSNRLPITLLIACHVILLTTLIATYSKLPEKVASHFNTAGQADGWMSRQAHTGFLEGTAVGLTALMIGAFSCVRFLPTSLINLPHREYWLAPERRAETSDAMLQAGLWLATFLTLFLLGLALLVVDANRLQPPHLGNGVWWLAGGFLLIVSGWITTLLRRFSRAPIAQ